MLYPQLNKCREFIKMDGFWCFQEDRNDVGKQEKWFEGLPLPREIGVPGSWNEQYSDLFDFMGKGWYEQTVFITEAWRGRCIRLRVGSACNKAKVWVNGLYVGSHEGGHLPFEFNIEDAVVYGEKNRIVILVDATLDPWGLPPAVLKSNEGRVGFHNCYPAVTYDFYPYGGLHRSIYIYTTDSCSIEDITIKTEIRDRTGIIHYDIELSKPVSGSIQIASAGMQNRHEAKNDVKISGRFEIPDVHLWDIGDPYLYELQIDLYHQEVHCDAYVQAYGVRTVKIEGTDFLLNGKKIFFKGFGKHEDFHVLGKGFNHCLVAKDFDLLQWIGANSFRTSHYPYDEEMLNYADRHGILVIDETPFVGLNARMYREDILEKAKGVIKELVLRDKNHPSVVMWSLANEPNADTPEGEHFFKEMAQLARALDDTRPITYVAHLEPENNLGMKYYDVVCLNKYYGWYIGPGQIEESLPEFSACLDRFHSAFHKPVFVAEFGADAVAGMHSEPAQMFSEEFQAQMIEKQYEIIRQKEYCIGAHVWAFADFKTAQSISRIIFNRKGLFTRERQPKLAAHKVRELWKKAGIK